MDQRILEEETTRRVTKTRLAIFTTGIYPFQTRGAEVGIFYLSRELARQGFNVDIYVAERSHIGTPIEAIPLPESMKIVQYSGTRIRFLFNISFLVKSLRKLSRDLERPAIIIVNIPTILSLLCAYLARLTLRPPYITIIHGPSDLVYDPSPVQKLQCSLIAASALRICVSNQILRILDRDCVLRDRVVRVIPNGYDPTEIAELSSAKSNNQRGQEIIFVGALTRLKDPITLVNCFKIVSAELPSVYLNIVGEGPLKDEVRQIAIKAGINNRIVFFDPMSHSNLLALIARSKLLVMTSREEGTPTAVIEALALGKPVVATAVGGLPDIISDGKNGYLTPVGDSELIADGIIKILREDRIRQQFSAAATESVRDFTWPKIAESYSHILISLAQEFDQ